MEVSERAVKALMIELEELRKAYQRARYGNRKLRAEVTWLRGELTRTKARLKGAPVDAAAPIPAPKPPPAPKPKPKAAPNPPPPPWHAKLPAAWAMCAPARD